MSIEFSPSLDRCLVAAYEGAPLEDRHPISRRVSNFAVALLSGLSDIPFIAVSLPLGKVLGPIAAAANAATFFVINYWCTQSMIGSAFGAKTLEEIQLVEQDDSQISKVKKGALFTLAAVVSMISQVPTALAGMRYNEEQYKIPAGLVLLVGGAILSMRSLEMSFEQFLKHSQSSKDRAHIIDVLQQAHRAFIDKSQEEKLSFIEELNTIDSSSGYMATLLNSSPPSQKSRIQQVFNSIGLGVGLVLGGIYEYALTAYTFVEVKGELYNNNLVGGLFAGSVLISTAYLTMQSVMVTSQRLFNVAGSFFTGKETCNLSWQLRPKLSAALTAIGLSVNVAALGPSLVMWGDFYNNDSLMDHFFPGAIYSAILLFFLTATLDINDEYVISLLKEGNDEEKEIAKIDGRFKAIINLMKECPDGELERYCRENSWSHTTLETNPSETTPFLNPSLSPSRTPPRRA